MSEIYEQGYNDYWYNEECPYPDFCREKLEWQEGYDAAQNEDTRLDYGNK